MSGISTEGHNEDGGGTFQGRTGGWPYLGERVNRLIEKQGQARVKPDHPLPLAQPGPSYLFLLGLIPWVRFTATFLSSSLDSIAITYCHCPRRRLELLRQPSSSQAAQEELRDQAMACSAVATSVSAALVPATQAWEGKTLSRQGLALAAPPRASRMVVNRSRVVMSATPSDNKVVSLTSLALLAAAVVPEIAEAAQPGVSPSLKNLLLSVVAGGTVLTVIGVAVAGVSTFDPVKRK
ncbi:uncharacterized protein [Physcomitrium patens]|nr:uncharacterized protein LOC112282820 [Physcomitrium patens]|eukprot:XP_024376667.1 uncharacterized protein LOC112282820 [Physcomitrella patens]